MNAEILKNTFNNVVDAYELARPTYPEELLQDVLQYAGKDAFEMGLEIGAGTGQATDLFCHKINQLDLVEVGQRQVDYLNHKYDTSAVKAYQAYYETFEAEKKYDLIYSATAFHWVDAAVGYPKAWDMLKDGGVMAVFWHMSSVTYHEEGIFAGLNAIKRKYLPDETLGFDAEGIEGVRQKRIRQIQSGNCFGVPVMKEYRWIDQYDAERYALLLESYSSTQTLSQEERMSYLAEVKEYIQTHGGVVEMPQHVMLYLMTKSSAVK